MKKIRAFLNKYDKYIRSAVMTVAFCVFAYSAYQLTNIYLDYKESKDAYNGINDIFYVPQTTDENGETVQSTDKTGIVLTNGEEDNWVWNYEKLLSVSPEALGWIKQDDGKYISYPIVQTEDNEYYLSHRADQAADKSGAIFVDYRIPDGLEARNAIIYGHDMKNDTMFGSLIKYADKDYYKEHPSFDIYIGDKHYRYDIFAVYETPDVGDTYTYEFADDDAFSAYLELSKSKSTYNIDVNVGVTDKIITLSTCTRHDDTLRYIVQAVRRDEITSDVSTE